MKKKSKGIDWYIKGEYHCDKCPFCWGGGICTEFTARSEWVHLPRKPIPFLSMEIDKE